MEVSDLTTSISSPVWCGVLYCTDVCVVRCVVCVSICACKYIGTSLLRTPLGPSWLSCILRCF